MLQPKGEGCVLMEAATHRIEPGFGDHLMRSIKLLHLVRQHAPRAHPQVDPMSYPLMFTLWARERRLSDLAEAIHLDTSTVSRQVSHLVDLGMVRRSPDPDDGRAQLLALTDDGVDLLLRLRSSRDTWLATLLDDWADDDMARFTTYLERFADALEARVGRASPDPVIATEEGGAP